MVSNREVVLYMFFEWYTSYQKNFQNHQPALTILSVTQRLRFIYKIKSYLISDSEHIIHLHHHWYPPAHNPTRILV